MSEVTLTIDFIQVLKDNYGWIIFLAALSGFLIWLVVKNKKQKDVIQETLEEDTLDEKVFDFEKTGKEKDMQGEEDLEESFQILKQKLEVKFHNLKVKYKEIEEEKEKVYNEAEQVAKKLEGMGGNEDEKND